MDEIKVGEYVRTKYGVIARVKSTTMVDNIKFYNCDNVIYEDTEDTLDYISENDIEKGILKHSFNIIDLIEVGDYVNGYKVSDKESTLLFTNVKGIDRSGYHIPISQYGDNIKSIVTKEMMESVEYRLN